MLFFSKMGRKDEKENCEKKNRKALIFQRTKYSKKKNSIIFTFILMITLNIYNSRNKIILKNKKQISYVVFFVCFIFNLEIKLYNQQIIKERKK